MSDILSKKELFELTEKKHGPAQARVLTRMGIEYRERPDGTLVVHRAARDEALGLRRGLAAVHQSNEINWN